MSLFNNRTDTEKELEQYRQQRNNINTNRKSQFDIPSNYNNPDNQFNNMRNNNINQNNRYLKGNKTDTKKFGAKWGIVFVIWFFVSLIAILVFAGTSTEWAIIIFGQIFFVFGMVAIISGGFDLSKVWLLLFPLLGLAFMGGGLISLYGTEEMKTQLYDILPFFVLGLFWIIGLGLIVSPIYSRKVKEKRCTLPVRGIIAGVNRRWSRGSRGHRGRYVYAPIYEYIYNGVLYRKESNVYTNYESFDIGSEVTVFLNPSDPDDYYVKRSQTVTVIIGIMFLIMSTAIIFLSILSNA